MAPSSEECFISTLDAAQEYMDLQQALAAALRGGFLSLAQARYSMGADRVSALQYPTHMQATARVRRAAAGDGDLELVLGEAWPEQAVESVPSSASAASGGGNAGSSSTRSSSSSWTAALPAATAAGSVAADETAAAAAAAVSPELPAGTNADSDSDSSSDVEEQLQRLRLAAQQSDSIVEQLAAKYGCSGSGSGNIDDSLADAEGYAEVTKPHKPLHWFGSLVAPSLRDAEGHFTRALAIIVQAANAQRQLVQGLDSYRAATAATPAPAAAAGAAAAAAEGKQ